MINSEAAAKLYATMKNRPGAANEPRDLGREWHSDSLSSSSYAPFPNTTTTTFPHVLTSSPLTTLPGLFENCPSDYSFLRMQSTPPAGGDTLWVSGYELYDR